MAIRYVQKDESKKWIITNEKENGTPLHVLKTKREALEIAHTMKDSEAVMVKNPSGWKVDKQKEATSKVVSAPVEKVQKKNINEPTQMVMMSGPSKPIEEPVQRVVDTSKLVEKTQRKTVNKVKKTQENIIEDPVQKIESVNKGVNQPTQLIQIPEDALVSHDSVEEPIVRTVKLDATNINQPTQSIDISESLSEEDKVANIQESGKKMIIKDEINDTVNIPLSAKAKEKNIKKEIKNAEVNVEQYQPYIKVGWPAWAGVLIAVVILSIFVGAIFLIGQYV